MENKRLYSKEDRVFNERLKLANIMSPASIQKTTLSQTSTLKSGSARRRSCIRESRLSGCTDSKDNICLSNDLKDVQ